MVYGVRDYFKGNKYQVDQLTTTGPLQSIANVISQSVPVELCYRGCQNLQPFIGYLGVCQTETVLLREDPFA